MKRRQFLRLGLAASAVTLTSHAPAHAATAPVTLANALWRIDVDPQSLALAAQPTGQPAVPLSRGVAPGLVTNLTHDATSAAWTLRTASGADIAFALTLDGRDLAWSLTASQPTTLDLIDQPPSAIGRGMILPLAEGSYIPTGNTLWRDYMTAHKSELNTTEDLSLPLWGLDHGLFTLHWLLTNPFNNLLTFAAEANDLNLRVSHEFTRLSPATPLTMVLHLGAPDLLDGARRYRQHRIATDSWESLTAKIAATPATRKLLGASHIYLWGNGLLGETDIRDWPAFVTTLRGPSPLATRLRGQFDSDALATLKAVKPTPMAYQKSVLVNAVNDALTALARQTWQTDDAPTDALVAAYPALRAQVVRTFGAAVTPDPATWGKGLSQRTFKALQQAGLTRLWIGLGDGWEGGLWNPPAVKAATGAGYLIAPYDSYETAIKPGERPDWATAQQGKAVFETCGIIKKDGTTKSGFQQAGVYTNTLCITPNLKTRVAAVAKTAGFNSWFLDVTASGLVFDDYRPGHEMTMTRNADANATVSRWIAQDLGMPMGSEDGKAVATGGAAFAHGMETPVIGWGDPDLQKTKTSPYYLGDWWPGDQPSVFFKPVPMKEPYRTVHFDPQYRLPLYQAVFHGSLITTHHWLYDSLKLTNAGHDRELAQLLYNTPPLYHLSAGTLKARLPVIARQDAFFRPLHEALAELTLDAFAWLSDDKHLQSTTFSDGTRLIANFATTARSLDGLALPPLSLTALRPNQPPQTYLTA